MILTALKGINLGLAFFVELAALAALGYWGFTVGPNVVLKFVLGLGAPALAVVIWAFFGAPRSSMQLQGVAYLALQALVFGSGALALVAAGQRGLGITYAIVAFVNSAAAAIWRQ
ncbi:MAG TPA: YrdB family protein [Ktedonobacterales bacterium]|nr:YrdB family protein [Ktedonobacterales bacterium]